ncbi:MAG TPA: RagB/SusD family nutrient uptake outer membrane protein [Phnomibacter sp.]|nr:RagB/SusD family nutrient uptake outer membrane protein [Phnomibacter sp.]
MKKNITILVLLALSLSGCDKWLELEPKDGIIKEEFWKTKEQVASAVTGIYSSMQEGASGTYNNPNYRPSMAEQFFVWGECRADNVAPATFSSNDDLDLVNVNIQPPNVNANWAAFYKTINLCNTVIVKAPEVLNNDNTFSQSQLNGYLSEAYTIRALMYFYLARTFAEVPLKLDATLSDGDLTNLPKSNQDSIFNQIEKDLLAAEAIAVTSYGNVAVDKGRVTLYTINAIKADLYLWMGKYTEAIAACDKIINSRRFGLIKGATFNGVTVEYSENWFSTLYVNGNSNEGIFELQYDPQILNPFFNIFSYSVPTRRWVAIEDLMDRVFTVDFTNAMNYDIRGDGASVRAANSTIWKYVAASSGALRSVDQSYAHWIFYRYADVLLMKAEALNEINQGQQALDLIYNVRTRANALAETDLSPTPDDKNLIQDFILAERAREFCFEGKRWYDVLRNARRNNYQRLPLLLNMIATSVPSNQQQSAQVKMKDWHAHYLPIYLSEMQTNKKLVQNPFYQ